MGRFASTSNVRLRTLMQWLDYNHVVPADVRVQTWLAFSFLAICLFNTIGLLLAKFLRRSGEIGVRRALGASRAAVFAQCLVEAGRSEERRVGTECGSTCRSRWAPDH